MKRKSITFKRFKSYNMDEYIESSLECQLENTPITIVIKKKEISTCDILPYLEPSRFVKYCKDGCPNFGNKWTCPPHCPDFKIFSQSYPRLQLYLFTTQVKQFNNRHSAQSLLAYDFTKEQLQHWLRKQENLLGGKMISANSCEICKTCSLVNGNCCPYPDKMRYNMTAFGFDITGIMTDIFNHTIEWTQNNKEAQYMSSIGALLLGSEESDSKKKPHRRKK